jgi:hypothetical protein
MVILLIELINSKFLLFDYNLKIYWNMKSFEVCEVLQADINAIQQWCENCMELNIHKTKITSFTCKTNSVHFKYCVKDISVLYCDYKKSLCCVRL